MEVNFEIELFSLIEKVNLILLFFHIFSCIKSIKGHVLFISIYYFLRRHSSKCWWSLEMTVFELKASSFLFICFHLNCEHYDVFYDSILTREGVPGYSWECLLCCSWSITTQIWEGNRYLECMSYLVYTTQWHTSILGR